MLSVTSKSAITPSFRGRTAMMLPGVRPIIRFASRPPATICPVLVLSATTEGSFRTIPRPLTYTSVLAVPRSTAMSRPMNDMLFAMWITSGLPERGRRFHRSRAGPGAASGFRRHCHQNTQRTSVMVTPCRDVWFPIDRDICPVRRGVLGQTGEEQLDLAIRGLLRVRGVDQVLADDRAEVPPDGARRCGNRVSRAG